MAKADWSGDDCGEILPADHFTKVTDREVARTSGTTRVYKGTRGGLGMGGSSSTSYRHVKRKVCPACMADRAERLRRARMTRLIVWMAMLIGGGLLLLILAGQPTPTPTSAPAGSAVGKHPESPVEPYPVPVAAPTDDALPLADPSPLPAQSVDQKEEAPQSQSDQGETISSPPRLAGNCDQEMRDAIAAATPGALESGDAVQWAGGGRHGYIVVSAPIQAGTKACRNAYWTITTPNNQIQGPAERWCKAEGGTWRKSE